MSFFPEGFKDGVVANTRTTLSWPDRIKALLGYRVQVTVLIATENMPGKTQHISTETYMVAPTCWVPVSKLYAEDKNACLNPDQIS